VFPPSQPRINPGGVRGKIVCRRAGRYNSLNIVHFALSDLTQWIEKTLQAFSADSKCPEKRRLRTMKELEPAASLMVPGQGLISYLSPSRNGRWASVIGWKEHTLRIVGIRELQQPTVDKCGNACWSVCRALDAEGFRANPHYDDTRAKVWGFPIPKHRPRCRYGHDKAWQRLMIRWWKMRQGTPRGHFCMSPLDASNGLPKLSKSTADND